jgi:hypothetical protein
MNADSVPSGRLRRGEGSGRSIDFNQPAVRRNDRDKRVTEQGLSLAIMAGRSSGHRRYDDGGGWPGHALPSSHIAETIRRGRCSPVIARLVRAIYSSTCAATDGPDKPDHGDAKTFRMLGKRPILRLFPRCMTRVCGH